MRARKPARLKRASIFHLPSCFFPPIGPPFEMIPDRLQRFRKNVAKPRCRIDRRDARSYVSF
jgi:hypothetical protein